MHDLDAGAAADLIYSRLIQIIIDRRSTSSLKYDGHQCWCFHCGRMQISSMRVGYLGDMSLGTGKIKQSLFLSPIPAASIDQILIFLGSVNWDLMPTMSLNTRYHFVFPSIPPESCHDVTVYRF